MTRLLLLRHGPTRWNAEGRIQGHTDIPLSPAGRELVARWRLPGWAAGYRLVASPLRRALETARILADSSGAEVGIDERLMEARWGEWEGERLEDLRVQHGPILSDNEARGLDFRPPRGESPRDVQTRLRPFLAETAAAGRPAAAVAHLGVIRAALALALDWDMTGKAPVRTLASTAHLFEAAPDGGLRLVEANVPLLP